MGKNIAQVYTLGPAAVNYNGIDLGHTDETGAKLMVKAKVVEAKTSKFGDTPVARWLNGQTAEVEFVIMQTDMTIIQAAIAGMTAVTNGGGSTKLTLGKIAGTLITPATLTLTPEIVGTPVTTWTMQATPDGDFTPTYEGGKWTGYKCKFVGTINEAGAAANSWLGTFGDPTITADAVAPVVSSVAPANAATGVLTSAVVVATMSKNLNGLTVDTESVQLIKDPAGTPTLVPGSVALVNAGAGTTVTFTPTSALTAAKTYAFVMAPTIKDLAGNALAGGFVSRFATA